jgi:Na+/H+ antiporter NhaD/arsenite permease-like protein
MVAANSPLLAAPFVGLLMSIALVPLLAPGFWHRHFGKIVAFWSAVFVAGDAAATSVTAMLDTLLEALLLDYLPFILVLAALFAIAGGLRVTGTPRGTPAVNTAMLALGAAIASIIGTTGAALVMIRPVIRANRHRRRRAHIVIFFIFLVANVGGALTPLGDPPLFLGYLAGVPFSWPLIHLAAPTALTAGGLLAVFYAFDTYVHRRAQDEPALLPEIEKLGVEGAVNLPLLALVVAAVLLHGIWHPAAAISVLGIKWGVAHIAADLVFVLALILSLRLTPARLRLENGFRWTPMIEVAILFIGIFITLIPTNAMIAAAASGPGAPLHALFFDDGMPRDAAFFWATGLLSAVLDNAPTYLVFFGVAGGDAATLAGPLARTLEAIAAGAVFCGALTYIGNAPNFMVKALAESEGIAMPGFLTYMVWSSLCLLPWLLLVQMIFFS